MTHIEEDMKRDSWKAKQTLLIQTWEMNFSMKWEFQSFGQVKIPVNLDLKDNTVVLLEKSNRQKKRTYEKGIVDEIKLNEWTKYTSK